MHRRIKDVVDVFYSGSQKSFSEAVGWSTSYTSAVLSGKTSIGLTPVLTILSAIPDLNARWLLFGTGEIIESKAVQKAVPSSLLGIIDKVISLEKYICVMSDDEIQQLLSGDLTFTPEQWDNWRILFENTYTRRDDLVQKYKDIHQ